MEKVWTPSSCLQPATFLTAAARTTHTSWRISSCKIHSGLLKGLFYISMLCYDPFHNIFLLLCSFFHCVIDQRTWLEKISLWNIRVKSCLNWSLTWNTRHERWTHLTTLRSEEFFQVKCSHLIYSCAVWVRRDRAGSVPLRYVVSSLELLVAEDYMIIYLNGATPRRKMPGISWLKRCYQMIDRK